MSAPLEVAARAAGHEPERRLAELARSGAPLRRAVAALAGRLVARRAWERLGYARLGDYARERLGLSGRSLQELARVDRALADRPRLEAALVSGRLPWSKVRLLTRFVSREDEAGWIARAAGTSVRALERRYRAVARGAVEAALAVDEEGGDAGPGEWLRVGAPLALAFRWRRTQRAAARVAGEPLGAAGVLELVTAEALSALPTGLEGEWEPERVGSTASEPAEAAPPARSTGTAEARPPSAQGSAPVRAELPRFLRRLVEGLETASAFELDARLRRVVRLEQRLEAEIAPLLQWVTASEYRWRDRYRTLAAYARDRLGISPRKARALLRLERLGELCPELRAAYRDGQLSWLQAQTLAPLLILDAEGPWRRAWLAWARQVTLRRLEQAVDRALGLREADPGAWHALRSAPDRIDATGDPADGERPICARPRELAGNVSIRVFAPRDVARLFRAVLCSVRLALAREPDDAVRLSPPARRARRQRAHHGPRSPRPVVRARHPRGPAPRGLLPLGRAAGVKRLGRCAQSRSAPSSRSTSAPPSQEPRPSAASSSERISVGAFTGHSRTSSTAARQASR